MANIKQPLDRKGAFAKAGARRNMPALPFLPRQNLYVLTCIDCRGDPAQILGIELSEALVQRNIGGRVTHAVINDVTHAAARAGVRRLLAW
jgi:carbonic anhydrase